MQEIEYKGHALKRGRTFQDWCVYFEKDKRARYGTLEEVKKDIDDYLIGSLPPKKQRF